MGTTTKILLVVAVLAVVVGGLAWYFFPDMEIDRTQKGALPPGVAAPKHDFTAVTAALQDDMGKIPATLKAPRAVPAHAFALKAQVQNALGQHDEYLVLNQVCDLIIHADQEHSVRLRDSQVAQSGMFKSALSEGNVEARNQARRDQIDKDAEAAWASYRKQTDDEVHRLLAKLEHRQL